MASRSASHSTGKDALEVVHTVLHAGGKFGGGGYKVSGGLHGVGVSVVNALSAWLRVETARDGGGLGPGVRARQADDQGREDRPAGPPAAAPRTRFMADADDVRDASTTRSTPIAQRLRESAYLTKGVWITLRDERVDRERSFYFEGGLVSFVRHLNRNKETLHPRPIYVERARRHDDHRGRAPVQRLVRRERPRVREQHQHGRRRHATSRASDAR